MDIKELKQKRFKLVKDARAILDAAPEEGLSAEDEHKYEEMDKEIDSLTAQIDKLEKADERRGKLEDLEDRMDEPEDEAIKPEPDERTGWRGSKEYREAFRTYLGSTNSLEERMGVERMVRVSENRALQMDADEAGGYTVVPEQFVADLIKDVDNLTFMRGLAKVYSVPKAQSLGMPSLDADPADPTWTGEILVGNEDSTMDFGKRDLFPHPLAQYIKVSKKLVRASALNIEQLVRERLAYKIAVVEENAFLNGTGANQPLGVFTASAHGISTGQDVPTGNTDTDIKADGLIEAKYNLKGQYWSRARWIFHRTAVKKIRKLKDGDGQYIWRPGLMGDRGDTILDVPVLMSEYAPSTFTSGLYVGIIGDFSRYVIADALDMTIQVLVELYAATNQNGYVSRKETDGQPVLENAFSRVTLA